MSISDEQLKNVRQAAAQNVLTKIRNGQVPTDAEWDLIYEHRDKPEKSPINIGEMLENKRHELFCQNIASGMTNIDAYLSAGFNCQRNSAATESGKLLKKPDIDARVRELRELAVVETVMNKTEALVRLTELSHSDKRAISAIQEIARLQGWYPDKRIDVEAGSNLMTLRFVEATEEDYEAAKSQ